MHEAELFSLKTLDLPCDSGDEASPVPRRIEEEDGIGSECGYNPSPVWKIRLPQRQKEVFQSLLRRCLLVAAVALSIFLAEQPFRFDFNCQIPNAEICLRSSS